MNILRLFSNPRVLLVSALILAALTRIALLSLPLVDDEFFHVLVGEAWWNTGELTMLDGLYTRAALYSKLVGLSFGVAGEPSWVAARLFPSVVCGVLLVGLIVWWVRREVGATAAILVAALMIFWPDGIEVSQFARFYALHGFLFCAGVVLVYYAASSSSAPIWQRIAMLVLAFVLFAIAQRLTVLTIIGVAGTLFWLFAVAVIPLLRRSITALALAALIAAPVIGAFFFLGLDRIVADLWSLYRKLPPGWDYDVTFYHRHLRDAYPSLWPLTLLLGTIALVTKPRLAFLCIAVFVPAFLALSLGHRVHLRYLYYIHPFLFILWAIAAQSLIGALLRFIYAHSNSLAEMAVHKWLRPLVAIVLVISISVFAIFSNSAIPRAARLAMGASGGQLMGDPRIGWPDAHEQVMRWAEDGALIVTSRTMISTAYIGDFDVAFSRLSVHDIALGSEGESYVMDPRDGRPLIGDRQELLRLISCTPIGVALSSQRNRGFDRTFFEEGRDLPLDLTIEEGRNFRMIGWRLNQPVDPEACKGLPIPTDGGAAKRLVEGLSAPVMGPARP